MAEKIFVIPGHGAGDSGACGNGYQEQERVRALATKIKQYGGDNVLLADFSRNYYADGGINRLTISKDYKIVELHMDSATPSAKGGHVIIQAGIGGADQWDKNLANLMKRMFPGRANTIVERSDLANPARAAARGYNYRLVENGFITNSGDVNTFNTRMDELAKGYLEAFGIPMVEKTQCDITLWSTYDTTNQRWKMEWDGEWFALRNLASGLYLDVQGASKEQGAKVQVYKGNGSDAQRFKVEPVRGLDYYKPKPNTPLYIIPKCAPELVLDVDGANDSNGARIQTWPRNAQLNQQWYMLDQDGAILTIISNMNGHRAIDVVNGGK